MVWSEKEIIFMTVCPEGERSFCISRYLGGKEMHYVIGDVHGCLEEMLALLDKIETLDKDAQFIFVGDFIDRGPKVWEVLQWVMKNITKDGKYQSVRGNHEQMALDWWNEYKVWYEEKSWEEPPKSYYDISEVLSEHITPTGEKGFHHPEDFKGIMEFFNSLPYHKKLTVPVAADKKADYRIVHAWYDYQDGENTIMQHQTNLYVRNYWGNHSNLDEVIVFGHTPTIAMDFNLRGNNQDIKGLIGYRENAINVDCGCVYGMREYQYPCMLGAICLENWQEFYPCTVEKRMEQLIRRSAQIPPNVQEDIYIEAMMEYYKEQNGNKCQEDNLFRKRTIERFGVDTKTGLR